MLIAFAGLPGRQDHARARPRWGAARHLSAHRYEGWDRAPLVIDTARRSEADAQAELRARIAEAQRTTTLR
jgi:hypothetical protein